MSLILAAALGAACQPRIGEDRPMPGGRNGTIVFIRSNGRVARLMSIDPRGGDPQPVGPREGTVGDPAWARDGSRLAFAWRRWPAGFQIAVGGVRERHPRVLTDGTSIDGSPTWSPDGSHLAFAGVRGERSLLFLVPSEGGGARALVPGRAPDWSPDGDALAFERVTTITADLFTYRLTDGRVETLAASPADDRDPDWSPDGARIAFASDRDGDFDIYVLDLGTRRVRRLTDDPADERWPEWSPDGRTIAFVRILPASSSIWLIGADGSQQRRLTRGSWDSAPAWRPIP
jgi:Tol biopolymer transport system component